MELSPEIREFILPHENQENYAHRTLSLDIANKIVEEGFQFSNSFQKTTDEIIDDMVYLKYWDTLRKQYGAYVIIISFSKKLLTHLQERIGANYETQQVLSTQIQVDTDENDELYLLPKEFIKGFIRRVDGEITKNPHFNPTFAPENLEELIELYKI